MGAAFLIRNSEQPCWFSSGMKVHSKALQIFKTNFPDPKKFHDFSMPNFIFLFVTGSKDDETWCWIDNEIRLHAPLFIYRNKWCISSSTNTYWYQKGEKEINQSDDRATSLFHVLFLTGTD